MAVRQIPKMLRSALKELKTRLKQELDASIRLILFGSFARGQAKPDSDVDVCLVLPEYDREKFWKALDIAWEVGFQHGLVISLLPFTPAMLQLPADMLPIAGEIRRDGIAI